MRDAASASAGGLGTFRWWLRVRQAAHRAGGNAAIHEQRLTGYVAAGFRGQEYDRRVQVVRCAGALEGNAVAEVFDPCGVLIERLVLFCAEPSGREAVDGDAVASPVVGEAHGELADAAAARAIGG